MFTHSPNTNLIFWQWIKSDRENKLLLWSTIAIMIISFTILKIAYPFPNFMPPDSYNYLEAGFRNDFISMWPIGYSKFLRLISCFSRSHLFIVMLQYLLLMASVCYFLFTIRFLFFPGKRLFRIVWLVSIANPMLPHIANFISSDCLFATLSLIWFTQMFWLIYKPSRKLTLIHATILLFAFTLRFTAIWYPFISILLIILSRLPWRMKLQGAGFTILLMALFIGRTAWEYKVKTNTWQYSAFGGWQMAANGLYGYAYSKPDPISAVPEKFRLLHTIVNKHMDSIQKLKHRPDDNPGIYYLWDFKSPLLLYQHQIMKQHPGKKPYFEQWSQQAPLYAAYGKWLILHHPWQFTKHYLWPNLLRYYAPPNFFMGMYNFKQETVDPIAVTWFGWSNNKLPVRTRERDIHIFDYFPTILSIINPIFLITSVVVIGAGIFKQASLLNKKLLAFVLTIWWANTLFSVFSAPIELRYQLFPIAITAPFAFFFIEAIIKSLSIAHQSDKQVDIIKTALNDI